jgi:uncharacterized OsmC-like protein
MDVKIEESWKKALAPLFERPYFTQITAHLKTEKALKRTIFPTGSMIFNAFNQTPYHQVKVEYHFYGSNLDEKKLEKAVNLSAEKYCGVMEMFRQFAKVEVAIFYHKT